MRRIDLGVLPGDGVGPEVIPQALKALEAAGERFGFSLAATTYEVGAERYLRGGPVLEDAEIEALRRHDALLLGAVGHPDVPPGVLERGLVVRLRTALDLYVNRRPIRLLPGVPTPIAGLTPARCDLVILRENTEGIYVGAGGVLYPGTAAEIATQESINTRFGVERIVRHAFDVAAQRREAGRGPGAVTLAHKTNVLPHAGGLWQRVFDEVAAEHPDIVVDYVHTDAACVHLVQTPERFDVIVTDNLFGDILSDLGAAVQGGLGLAPSANVNPETGAGMFEPVHGSAPDIAGRGWANPAAAVLSAALCLEHLGESDAAAALEAAVAAVLPTLRAMGGPDMGASTAEVGDRIAAAVAAGGV